MPVFLLTARGEFLLIANIASFHVERTQDGFVTDADLRPTDAEAGRPYRAARLHYVSDLILNRLDADVIDYAMASIAAAAPWSAGALLLCTSNDDIAAAASRAGWLDEQSPVLGARLAAKAPKYMLGGGLVGFADADIHLSFADSDVDLNI